MTYTLHQGDCLEVLRTLPDASVDAIVTDPPYGLSFMGKRWDYDVPSVDVWAECLRVLKPGGHLLAFAGTRTQHRMAVRIEDAGFEIRDLIAWVYGSGFPKSLDVSKAINAQAGAEREVVEPKVYAGGHVQNTTCGKPPIGTFDRSVGTMMESKPSTPAARQWQGWGTALKPALEPITVARKPLDGTVAENVLAHGTGALNVDGCRVEALDGGYSYPNGPGGNVNPSSIGLRKDGTSSLRRETPVESNPLGRWPANLIHDGSEEVVGLFPETGPSRSQDAPRGTRPGGFGNVGHASGSSTPNGQQHDDAGGSAARFFYCAKASKADRDAGCEGMEKRSQSDWPQSLDGQDSRGATPRSNHHPTVKPTDLMRYLCRLVTPPGGVVLDPFTGSGSTGRGAILEGFRFIGIEREPEYVAIARARIEDAVGTRRAQTAQGKLGL